MKLKSFFEIDINPDRVYGLDIIRAFAILFVVAGHGGNLMESETYKYIDLFLFDGVSIFFVLSGFLIGRILIEIIKEKSISFKVILNFWIRRWFRTLPNYYLILTLVVFLNVIFNKIFNPFDYYKYFLFSQNLFHIHPNFFPEAWSLSIEEWFYIITPLIIFILIRVFILSVDKSILITVAAIILFTTLFRYYRFSSLFIDNIETWNSMLRTQILTRLDSLMYGLIGAYIYINYFNFWSKYKVQLFVIGLFLFTLTKFNFLNFSQFGLYDCVFSFSVVSIATLFLLPYLSLLKNGRGFIYKYTTIISLISYSMYLVNYTIVLEWIIIKIDWRILANFNSHIALISKNVLFWFLTIFISIITYKYFEIPLMKLRDKLEIK
ncbi:acyltransferase family protein [Mariniflexile sp.]|uniref:acyltransferase family protein n=1 Tax=Mariniflexile sp. TaxID=1979402 RepID=UPI0035661B22